MMDIHFNPPIHPGEMLREEFMQPLKLSAGKLSKAIGVPRSRIERLVREETGLSIDTAVRLAKFFQMSEGYWIGLQTSYEVDRIHADTKRLAALDKIKPLQRPDLDGQEAA